MVLSDRAVINAHRLSIVTMPITEAILVFYQFAMQVVYQYSFGVIGGLQGI